jgi:hypothetical protein
MPDPTSVGSRRDGGTLQRVEPEAGRMMKRVGFVNSLFAAMLLSGCVVTATAPPPRGVLVNGPPPAPLREDPPTPPHAAAVFVTGYWHWTGMHYTWIPGHYETRRPGAVWAAPRYVQSEGSYFYEPGGWHAAPTNEQPAPPAPPVNVNAIH